MTRPPEPGPNIVSLSFSKWARWILGGLLALGVSAFWLSPLRPEAILILARFHERRGEEGEANAQRMSERLVACGPTAIAPIIQTIRKYDTWNRTYGCLPFVLKQLGEPAHVALLAAIDFDQDAPTRGRLISALHRAFSDFSRLDRWLNDAVNGNVSSYQLAHFAGDVRETYPDAPELSHDGRLSADFADWWRTNKATR